MRAGVMAMQLELILAQIGEKPRLATNGSIRLDLPALVRQLAEAGFPIIELNTELELFFPGCFEPATVERLVRLKDELALDYTVHLPLWGLEPALPDPRLRRATVEVLADAIRRTAPLAPLNYVLHCTGAVAAEFAAMPLPAPAAQVVIAHFLGQARASLLELLNETRIEPRLLALENIEFPWRATLALAEEFDTSVCLDTGHVLAGYSGEGELSGVLDAFAPRLLEVHLHDGFAPASSSHKPADHLALGEGHLDLPAFSAQLKQSCFHGAVVFELGLKQALASKQAFEASLASNN